MDVTSTTGRFCVGDIFEGEAGSINADSNSAQDLASSSTPEHEHRQMVTGFVDKVVPENPWSGFSATGTSRRLPRHSINSLH